LFHGDAKEAENDVEALLGTSSTPLDYTYVNHLTMMENAFENLTHLDCSVSEEEENGGLFIAARPSFEFLRCAKKLEKVHLSFGQLEDIYLRKGYWFREKGDGAKELLTLLTEYTPWSKIKELEIEIVTDERTLLQFLASLKPTLRRLKLSAVTLSPSQGSWDSALPAIAASLENLEELNLSMLCDYPQHEHNLHARYLFDDQLECWYGKSACYTEYKKSVIGYLLYFKELPQHEAQLFLEAHRQCCPHVKRKEERND
jgi:hypothetical protein